MKTTNDHLRGPWLAVLADRDGFVYPTYESAVKDLDEDEEMTISVVRGSALPVGEPDQLRMTGSYYDGDVIFEVDAYLTDDDKSVGAEARYAQAEHMADGLNHSAEPTVLVQRGNSALFLHTCGNAEWWDEQDGGPINEKGCDNCESAPHPDGWVPLYVRNRGGEGR